MNSSIPAGIVPDQATRGFLRALLGQGMAAAPQRTLWDTLRGRWVRPHASATSDARPAAAAAQQVDFHTWSECVRQLLGPTDGDPGSWPALYAGGATPLEAARWAVLGHPNRWPTAGSMTAGEL